MHIAMVKEACILKRQISFCVVFLCLSCVFSILFFTTFSADSYSEKNTIKLSATVSGNSIVYSNASEALRISLKEYETSLLIPAEVWEKKCASIESKIYSGAVIDFNAASDSVDEFRGQMISLATSLQINGEQVYDINEYNIIVHERIMPRRILILSVAAIFLGLFIINAINAIIANKRHKSSGNKPDDPQNN